MICINSMRALNSSIKYFHVTLYSDTTISYIGKYLCFLYLLSSSILIHPSGSSVCIQCESGSTSSGGFSACSILDNTLTLVCEFELSSPGFQTKQQPLINAVAFFAPQPQCIGVIFLTLATSQADSAGPVIIWRRGSACLSERRQTEGVFACVRCSLEHAGSGKCDERALGFFRRC